MSSNAWQPFGRIVGGNWSQAGHWSLAAVPGSGDTATIGYSATSAYTVTVDGSYAIAGLVISSSAATLGFNTNTSLTVTGTTTLSAGTIALGSSGATLSTGVLTTSAGTAITIGTGATLLAGSGIIGGTISGSDTVEAVGGTLDITTAIGANSGLTYAISNASASLLQLDSTVGTGNTFSFLGTTGELWFNSTANGGFNSADNTTQTETVAGMAVGTSANSSTTNFIQVAGDVTVSGTTNAYTGTSGTVTLSTGDVINLTNVTGGSGTWYVDTSYNTATNTTDIFLASTVCFAAGTRILTASGEQVVESLRPGDTVLTLTGDTLTPEPVKWIGYRRIDLTAHPRPEMAAPIRIQRHAFADNRPHTDLVVSPDHALFVDGKLIAARQLVNGSTIRRETACKAVEYFHVELDRHAILLSEGLPTESYLDTGNRGFFANGGDPLILHPDLMDESDCPAREAASCAPFVCDEPTVLPVWQRLADRAATLGQPAVSPETTRDTDLHLLIKGRALRPLYAENGLFIFALPRGTAEARLVSRAAAPADARPWLDDRRVLGVHVQQIIVRDAAEVTTIALDDPALSQGWWDVERNGVAMRRWTDGNALLPLPRVPGVSMLEIRAGGLDYVIGDDRRAAA
jgi:hypothetical protein